MKHTSVVRILLIAVLTVTIFQGVAMLLVLTFTTGLSTAAAMAVPKFSRTHAKVERIRRLSTYRIKPDSTISGLRAGQALYAVIRNGPGGALRPFEKPPAISIPPQPDTKKLNDSFDSADGGFQVVAFRQAPRGLSTSQREYLRALADNTALEEFRVMARAPSLDLAAAYWDIRPGSVPSWMQLPIPKFAPVTAAANANIAQAALDFAAGRRQEAELRLRETISAGFLMLEDGHLIIENLVGTNIVSKARMSLMTLFEVTGRAAEAKSISPERDPVITIVEPAMDRRPSVEEISGEVRRVILDDTEILGLRWEMLVGWLVYEPCTDMHQVIFGADSLQRATIEQSRAKLVRTPSDSVLFRVIENASDRPAPRGGAMGQYDWERHRPVARLMSALTGNRQFEACLGLLGLR